MPCLAYLHINLDLITTDFLYFIVHLSNISNQSIFYLEYPNGPRVGIWRCSFHTTIHTVQRQPRLKSTSNPRSWGPSRPHRLRRCDQETPFLTSDVKTSLGELGALDLLSSDAQVLQAICQKCEELSIDLLLRLNKLQTGDNHRKWKSFRQAIKSVYTKAGVDALAKRFTDFREELVGPSAVIYGASLSKILLQYYQKLQILKQPLIMRLLLIFKGKKFIERGQSDDSRLI